MPELHKNQIKWEAPEPRKVDFDKPNYTPLADAFNRLGDVSDAISKTAAKVADDKLKNDLAFAEAEANKIIDDAKSATADYDSLSEMALSKVQEAFDKYDPETRTRFLRENKNYIDSLQLAVSDKILQKKRSQLENDVELNIPQWTSEALNRGKEGLQWMLNEKIAKTLEGLSLPETISKLQFSAKHYYDTASVNNGLNGDEASVRRTLSDLRNPKKYDTLNAYERSVSYSMGLNKMDSLEKAKKAGDDPNFAFISEMYATYAMQQDSASQDKLYKQIVGLDPSPILVGVTYEKDGKPVPKYIHMDQYPASARLALATKLTNSFDKYNGAQQVRQNLYENDLRKMLIEYKDAEDSNSSNRALAISNLDNMRHDVNRYSKVDEKTRKDIDSLIDNEINARIEALNVPDFYADNLFFSGKKGHNENPASVLAERIRSGAQPQTNQTPYGTFGEFYAGTNVTPSGRSDGGLLQDMIQKWKGDFDNDMKRDSVSEYALVSTFVLKSFRDAGKLAGTRLEHNDRDYVVSLVKTMDTLIKNGSYNETITDENSKQANVLYSNLLGPGKAPTEDEQKLINEMSRWATTAQSSRDSSQVVSYLTRPEPSYVREEQNYYMGGAYLQPAKDMLDTIWMGSPSRKSIKEAQKEKK